VIGWPIAHSRSPLIHNHWMARYHIDAIYDVCPIDPATDFRAALEGLANEGYVGANVTIPHKENAFAAMDDLSPQAAKLGAVNVIAFKDGRMIGHNTDGAGFIASLDAYGTRWRDTPALVLGAGGAARAIIAALGGCRRARNSPGQSHPRQRRGAVRFGAHIAISAIGRRATRWPRAAGYWSTPQALAWRVSRRLEYARAGPARGAGAILFIRR
jgi:shikimate dehydrogenase